MSQFKLCFKDLIWNQEISTCLLCFICPQWEAGSAASEGPFGGGSYFAIHVLPAPHWPSGRVGNLPRRGQHCSSSSLRMSICAPSSCREPAPYITFPSICFPKTLQFTAPWPRFLSSPQVEDSSALTMLEDVTTVESRQDVAMTLVKIYLGQGLVVPFLDYLNTREVNHTSKNTEQMGWVCLNCREIF